jgi:hypothetical protein
MDITKTLLNAVKQAAIDQAENVKYGADKSKSYQQLLWMVEGIKRAADEFGREPIFNRECRSYIDDYFVDVVDYKFN